MPNFGGLVSGAAGGASIGSLFPGAGTIIGAGVGGLLGLFSKSPEDERTDRKRQLLAAIANARARAIRDIAQETAGQMASARAAASRRALSLGRQSEAESFILPAESQVGARGSSLLRQTGREFDQQTLSAEAEFANRPIQPGVGDYLMELGGAALEYKQGQDYLNVIRGAYGLDPSNMSATDLDKYFSVSAYGTPPRIGTIQPPELGFQRKREQRQLPRITPMF